MEMLENGQGITQKIHPLGTKNVSRKFHFNFICHFSMQPGLQFWKQFSHSVLYVNDVNLKVDIFGVKSRVGEITALQAPRLMGKDAQLKHMNTQGVNR